jgi:hypothetical protein
MAFPQVTMDEWNIIAIKLSVSVCFNFCPFLSIQEQNCMATSNHRSNMAVEIIANGKSNCEAF